MTLIDKLKMRVVALEQRVAEWLAPLELMILPATLTVITALVMTLLSLLLQQWPLPLRAVLFFCCGAVSITVGVAALRQFRRHKTTWRPDKPQLAMVLVTTGIYRRSRNPMYLAVLIMLVGWGFWLGNEAALLPLPLFFYLLTRLQIIPEERLLTQKFGDRYRRYCEQVRRWL